MVDLKKELPEVFNDFAESRQNAFLKVKEIKDKDIPVIGIFCTFFPQELTVAAGATCVSLCATSDETIQDAERDLPKNLCPLSVLQVMKLFKMLRGICRKTCAHLSNLLMVLH